MRAVECDEYLRVADTVNTRVIQEVSSSCLILWWTRQIFTADSVLTDKYLNKYIEDVLGVQMIHL